MPLRLSQFLLTRQNSNPPELGMRTAPLSCGTQHPTPYLILGQWASSAPRWPAPLSLSFLWLAPAVAFTVKCERDAGCSWMAQLCTALGTERSPQHTGLQENESFSAFSFHRAGHTLIYTFS